MRSRDRAYGGLAADNIDPAREALEDAYELRKDSLDRAVKITLAECDRTAPSAEKTVAMAKEFEAYLKGPDLPDADA